MNTQIFDPVEVDYEYFLDHLDEQDLFYEKSRALPTTIKACLFGTSLPSKVQSLADRFGFTEKQSALLSRLIRKVFVAEVFIGDLIRELKDQLDLPQSKAQELADALTTELFAPAIDDLKQLHAQTFAKSQSPQPQSQGNVLNLKSTSQSTN